MFVHRIGLAPQPSRGPLSTRISRRDVGINVRFQKENSRFCAFLRVLCALVRVNVRCSLPPKKSSARRTHRNARRRGSGRRGISRVSSGSHPVTRTALRMRTAEARACPAGAALGKEGHTVMLIRVSRQLEGPDCSGTRSVRRYRAERWPGAKSDRLLAVALTYLHIPAAVCSRLVEWPIGARDPHPQAPSPTADRRGGERRASPYLMHGCSPRDLAGEGQ